MNRVTLAPAESVISLRHLTVGSALDKRDALVLHVTVPGDPLSKQRPRLSRKTGAIFTPGETRKREAEIGQVAKQAMSELSLDPMGLFSLRCGFYLATNQRRDVDNMLKLVSDALTGVIWADDSQVAEVFSFKVHAAQPAEARSEIAVFQMAGSMPWTFARCLVCQRNFRTYPSWKFRQCCSRRCWGLSIRRRVTLTCAQCGIAFERAEHRATVGAPLCSVACKRIYGSETRSCVLCGSPFKVARATRKKTCSRRCASGWRFHANRPLGPVAAASP